MVGMLFVVLTLFSLVSVLITSERKQLVQYTIWSMGLLFFNTSWWHGFVWILIFVGTLGIVGRLLNNQLLLYIKPKLRQILPHRLQQCFLGISILMALSLFTSPDISLETVAIDIPDSTWEQVWSTLKAGDKETVTKEQGVFEQTLTSIDEAASDTVETEVESVLTGYIHRATAYWPYIFAFVFFVTAQIATPVVVYLGLIVVEIVVYILMRSGLLVFREEPVTAYRFELQ